MPNAPVPVDLSGVSATLLSNLGRRAAAAQAKRPLLEDPVAVEAARLLDYDFAETRGASLHALRVGTFDRAVRRFVRRHPNGTVVALGEGLETQFWRVDNGSVSWLTVDLPAALELRRAVLPAEPRVSSHAGSALTLDWAEEVKPGPTLLTAQGLLPYFQREDVHRLIAGIAERLPGSTLVFDAVPVRMLEVVRRMPGRESEQAAELWSWLFSTDERAAIAAIPGVARIRDLSPPPLFGLAPVALRAVRALPRAVRYALPVIPVLEIGFGEES